MRILVWHGWLLEGAGSNVYTARIVETWRAQGHDVLLVCQERHPERFPFIDAFGAVGAGELEPTGAEPAAGRAVLLRPSVGGDLLPVFVYDEYEGFRPKTFVDLTDQELRTYLDASVAELARAAEEHRPEVVVVSHAFPGAVVAKRALGDIPYVPKIHGSDIEYAMRLQPRYLELGREGLEGAAGITGASRDVNRRLVELVPSVADKMSVAAPGVEMELFRPMPREEALDTTAKLLEQDEARHRGRPTRLDGEVSAALMIRDAARLDELAALYDQTSADVHAPDRLEELAGYEGPLVGYLGKLIPQKGVDHLITAIALLEARPRALIVGYGTFREWLETLVTALDRGDQGAIEFLRRESPMMVDLTGEEIQKANGLRTAITFTGRLDHRYAATALAALDVLVVPSILDEAFGMVAVEGAAAGALPLVARHSGLAEIAEALEAEVGEPGLLSYEPGAAASRDLAAKLQDLLAIPPRQRQDLAARLSAYVAERWSWTHTASALLEVTNRRSPRAASP